MITEMKFFDNADKDIDLGKEAKILIERAIEEDCALRDITTLATIPENALGKGRLIAKENGVLAGIELANPILKQFPGKVDLTLYCQDGDATKKDDIILELTGSLRSILGGERILLNFIQRLSGIATLTSKIVSELGGNTKIRLLDTRKTAPGFRKLEKYAVSCGGGLNHRMSLADMFLVKENHIQASGSIEKAILGCLQFQKENSLKVPIETEVQSLEEFKVAHDLGVALIMLDHFTEEMVFGASKLNVKKIPIEVSGNITLESVSRIRKWPVEYISVGAITHSAPALDLSLLIE